MEKTIYSELLLLEPALLQFFYFFFLIFTIHFFINNSLLFVFSKIYPRHLLYCLYYLYYRLNPLYYFLIINFNFYLYYFTTNLFQHSYLQGLLHLDFLNFHPLLVLQGYLLLDNLFNPILLIKHYIPFLLILNLYLYNFIALFHIAN